MRNERENECLLQTLESREWVAIYDCSRLINCEKILSLERETHLDPADSTVWNMQINFRKKNTISKEFFYGFPARTVPALGGGAIAKSSPPVTANAVADVSLSNEEGLFSPLKGFKSKLLSLFF